MYTMPIRRLKAARRLAAMLRGHGNLIAEKLAPRMAKVLEEGEAMPDVRHLLDVLGRMVEAESQGLDKVNAKRQREGSQARWLRRELRDKAEPQLRSRVSEVRRQMVLFYGRKETEAILTFSGRTPRKLEDLEDLAVYMVRHLPGLKPPQAPGVTFETADWAEFIRPALDDVSRLMDALDERSWQEDDAVKGKHQAVDVFDRTFRRVLRVGEIFYELAGLESLAKHLRNRAGRPTEQKKSTPTKIA